MKWSLTTCSSRRIMIFGIIGLLVSQWGQRDVFFFSRPSVEPLKLFLVGFRVQAILADVPQPFFDRFAWNDKKRNIPEECRRAHFGQCLGRGNDTTENPARLGMHKTPYVHEIFTFSTAKRPRICVPIRSWPWILPVPSTPPPEGVQKLWLHHRPLQPWADQGLKQRKVSSFRFVLGVELTIKRQLNCQLFWWRKWRFLPKELSPQKATWFVILKSFQFVLPLVSKLQLLPSKSKG